MQRSYNVCKKTKLYCLRDIYNYYLTNHSFLNIKNIGSKTNQELIELCKLVENKKISINLSKNINLDNDNTISIDNLLEKRFITLRAYNILSSLGLVTMSNVYDYYKKHYTFLNIKNVGKTTNNQLILLNKEFETDNKKFKIVNEKYILDAKKYKNNIKNKEVLNNINNILNSEGEILFERKIYFFLFLDKYIENSFLWSDSKYNYIFKFNTGYVENSINTLEESGLELQITRERVRQIKNSIKLKIVEFINELNSLWIMSYELNNLINKNDIILIQEFKKSINNKFSLKFSVNFYNLILKILLKDYNSYEHINNNYLFIKKGLNDIFDYGSLLWDIKNKLKIKKGFTHNYSWSEVRNQYLKTNNIENIKMIDLQIKKIFSNIEGLEIDINNQLKILPNKNVNIQEASYLIIKEYDRPMYLDEIYCELKKRYPNLKNRKNSIRNVIIQDKRIGAIGKQSLYALKIWERTKINMYYGYIRDLAFLILNNSDKPIDFNELYIEANKFRKFKKGTLLIDLNNDSRFIYLGYGFYAIKNKKYKLKYNVDKNYNISGIQRMINNYLKDIKTNKIICIDKKIKSIQEKYGISDALVELFIIKMNKQLKNIID